MGPIRSKLAGRMGDERQVNAPTMSVVNQVEILIKEAVSYSNLVSDTRLCSKTLRRMTQSLILCSSSSV